MANSTVLDRRLRTLEQQAARYSRQGQQLTLCMWLHWLRTGEQPASELARVQIARCVERRQQVEAMLAELDIPDDESEFGSTFESA